MNHTLIYFKKEKSAYIHSNEGFRVVPRGEDGQSVGTFMVMRWLGGGVSKKEEEEEEEELGVEEKEE